MIEMGKLQDRRKRPASLQPFLREWPCLSALRTLLIKFISSGVIYKLLGFTLAMIVGPIGTYFLTLGPVFHGLSSLTLNTQETRTKPIS